MAVEPLLSTRPQRAFIITISIQALVVIAMVAITFRMVNTFSGPAKTLPCYLSLFALAEIFELLMAYDALRLRNVIQLIGILMFHGALMVFAALQFHQTKTALFSLPDCGVGTDCPALWEKVEIYLIIAPCVIAGSWFVLLFWVKKLYAEFGWAIFHVVGANPTMKTMYQWYQIMVCLLKFDFFAFTGVTMQLLIVVLRDKTAEFVLTIAAIPVVLILLAACGLAVAREIKWLMTISLVLMLAALCYLFKLVRFYEPATEGQYITTRATLTVFTIVAFLLQFATFAVGLRCFSDFDKGLLPVKVNDVPTRPKITANPDPTGNMNQRQQSYLGGTQLAARISIE